MRKRGLLGRILIFTGIIATLCGCGKESADAPGKAGSQALVEDEINYVYDFAELEMPDAGSRYYVEDICINNSGTYILVHITSEDYESSTRLYHKGPGEEEFITLPIPDDGYYSCFAADDKGNYCIAQPVYYMPSEFTDDTDGANDYSGEIISYQADGTEIWSIPLSGNDADNGIKDMEYVDDTGILALTDGKVFLYDAANGEKRLVSERGHSDENYYEGYLHRTRDKAVYLCEPDSNWDYHLYKFDVATGKFGAAIDMPENSNGYLMWPGQSCDFYYSQGSELYSFNIGDTDSTKVCDYTASDMILEDIKFAGDTSDGKLYMCAAPSYNYNARLYLLTKAETDSNVSKIMITIGMDYIREAVREQVVKYNKSSDKYRVRIIDYSKEEGAEELETSEIINLAIAQGNAPDILVFDYDIPWRSYISKGLFEPLDSYIESDKEIQLENYLPNIISAMTVQDSIYYLIPRFAVSTCIAAKDNVDGIVTMENYAEVCKKNGIDPSLGMGYMPREYAEDLYMFCANDLVDYDNKTCNFDSDEFKQVLKFIGKLPSLEELDRIGYDELETYYMQNKSLLMHDSFYEFNDYQVAKKGYFGCDVVFNGFPTPTGGKSFIYGDQYAITSTSKNKEAAWDFLRTFLLDEFQEDQDFSFPISKKALDNMTLVAQQNPFYIDENGEKHEMSSYYGIGNLEVEITALTKAETDEFCDFITSVDGMLLRDNVLTSIIEEEASAFYEGAKSADEVAKIIQSRATIYLNE